MDKLKKIPCDKNLDSTLCLLTEGYPFIQNRCFKHKSDIFETKIIGKKVICMSGRNAAKVFYNDTFFKRKNLTLSKRVQKTLFGQHGIQGLDGIAHKDRKQMFMSIMSFDNMKLLSDYTISQWKINSEPWRNKDIVLFEESKKIMCQIACRWAEVPLDFSEVNNRTNDLADMIDGFGGVGIRYWKGRCARMRSEAWMKDIIIKIRTHKINPSKNSAAYMIAWHKDERHRLLNPQIAAVELLNIIRPIVAISTYITFGALAMYENPECRQKLRENDSKYTQMFIQEVRRYYPFTPFVGAQSKKSFLWKQYLIKKGTPVLLDIYGMNHDARYWTDPYEFIPERFSKTVDDTYTFMPQGGGDYKNGHRCAGEMVTIEIMKESLKFIAKNLKYTIPKQNLNYCLSRIPTHPKSGFIMTNVQRKL